LPTVFEQLSRILIHANEHFPMSQEACELEASVAAAGRATGSRDQAMWVINIAPMSHNGAARARAHAGFLGAQQHPGIREQQP
jgi:hypothetical protein